MALVTREVLAERMNKARVMRPGKTAKDRKSKAHERNIANKQARVMEQSGMGRRK